MRTYVEIYTSDDEKPSCSYCDNRNDDDKCDGCDAEHHWCKYIRSVLKEKEE